MVQESTTAVSPSSSTGTFSDPCGTIAFFSVKHHGMVSADSPLCASAIRVRQQYGLKGRVWSVPTSSKSLRVMLILCAKFAPKPTTSLRAKRSNPYLNTGIDGLLRRFAPRNDGGFCPFSSLPGLTRQSIIRGDGYAGQARV